MMHIENFIWLQIIPTQTFYVHTEKRYCANGRVVRADLRDSNNLDQNLDIGFKNFTFLSLHFKFQNLFRPFRQDIDNPTFFLIKTWF